MKTWMKVLTAGITAGIILSGCSSSASENNTSDVSAKSTEKADTSDTQLSDKPIIIYFSATGNTKNIADMIADYTGGEEYEVQPSDPYTDDDLNYSDESSRVVLEYENPDQQDVAFGDIDIPDWDKTDIVFVGYPIWWQDASWVMKSFVKKVDFTGKTVIPFWTSSSSQAEDSGKNLGVTAGTGNWEAGQRFSGSASQEEVDSWVDSLQLQ